MRSFPFSSFFLVFLCIIQLPAQDSSEDAHQQAEELYQQGIVAFSTNRDSAALLLQKALPLYEAAETWADYVKCLNGLAFIYYNKNDFSQYPAYNQSAVAAARKHLPPDHVTYLQSINNLHAYYYTIGDFDQSIKLMKEVIATAEKVDLVTGDFYHNLGNSYRFKGDYQRSIEYLKKTLLLQKDSLEDHLVPSIYQDIGRVFQNHSQLDSALYYFGGSLDLLESADQKKQLVVDYTVENLLKLAELWCLKERTDKAQVYLRRVLAMNLKERPYDEAHAYERLGQMHRIDRDFSAALNAYNKAHRIATTANRRNTPPFAARRLGKIAELYALLNKTSPALKHYEKALQALSPNFVGGDWADNPEVEELLSQQDALTILDQKAQLLWRLYLEREEQEILEASFQTYFTASQLIRNIRQGIITAEAKNILSEKSVPIYEGAIRSALALYQVGAGASYLEKAFALAESNKALLLLEALNEQAAKGQAGIPDSLLEREKSIQLKINYLKKTLLEQHLVEPALKNIEDQLFSSKQELEQLITRLEEEYPRYFKTKYQNEAVPLEVLQAELKKSKTALIEYFVGEKAIYLFSVNGDDIQVQELENRQEILDATASLQALVNQPPERQQAEDFLALQHLAHQLYTQLIASLDTLWKTPPNALIIIPDHLLNFVPFDLLLSKMPAGQQADFSLGQLEYLIERYAISYDYSATLYVKNQGRKKEEYERDFLGFAPSFKGTDEFVKNRSCDEEELYDLQCSDQEVSGIQGRLNGLALLAEDANKAAFVAKAANSRILHLATHACIDEQNSLYNKIFLTDDYLSNADLYNLDIRAELAVLSACNTGAGKLIKGEGVMSLARGFITAGCASTVVSRWSVNDCATAEIMQHFYRQLEQGLPKNEALRQAKINYLQESDKVRRHPYYWAAFVPFGNIDALQLSAPMANTRYYLLLLLLLALAGYFFFRRSRV